MDNEKDFYIKQMLKKDDLMSKKAEDVFNNFLEGEIKMEKEKVVNINEAKDKKFNRKKILSIVATLVVVFLGANVYAATQGYNNIFFMIKNIATTGTISGKAEILKDKDITISYEPIEVAKGVKVQFNRFIVKDNKAKLIMVINQEEANKRISQIEVINGYDNSELVTTSLKNDNDGTFTEEIEIGFFNDNINILKININGKKENLAIMQIDLNNREITVLSNSFKEIEKISEIELKEVLGNYAILNSYEDMNEENAKYENKPTKKQYINQDLLGCATNYISYKESPENNNIEKISFAAEKVHKAIKEMAGKEIKNYLDLPKEAFFYYNGQDKKYETEAGDPTFSALCLNIIDISYEDGIYSVDYQYCYPSEADYIEGTINELPVYESTIQLKLNDNYEYIKYCIVSDIYNLRSNEVLESKHTEDSQKFVNTSYRGNTTNTINTGNIVNSGNTIYTNKVDTTNTINISNTVIVEEEEPFGKGYKSIDEMFIEERDSEKIKNYKDFNYDLDGDGIIDKITIRKDKTDNDSRNYLFELNGAVFAENSMHPEILILDFDKNDSTLEVVIYDAGPSDDPEYSIYVKNGNKMELISQISGIDMVLDSNGNFKVKSILTDRINPHAYDIVYIFKDNYITSKVNDFDKSQNYYSYGGLYITKDLNNIDKANQNLDENFNESLRKTEIIELKMSDTFRIKSFIDYKTAIIEYKGEEYYLLSHQGNFAD